MEQIKRDTELLLKIGSMLTMAGANTDRIHLSIEQFAKALGYRVQPLVTHKAIVLTVQNEQTDQFTTLVQRIPFLGVNFKVISGLSRASWSAVTDGWGYEKIKEEVERLSGIGRYPELLTLVAVAAAGAGFCQLFGGDWQNMLIAFAATFVGVFCRHQAMAFNFNQYISVFIGSLSASMVAALGVLFNIGLLPHVAMATSVLFLVPGVPLINSFTDLMDGNIINGLVRFAHGCLIVFGIAMGLAVTMTLFHLHTI